MLCEIIVERMNSFQKSAPPLVGIHVSLNGITILSVIKLYVIIGSYILPSKKLLVGGGMDEIDGGD